MLTQFAILTQDPHFKQALEFVQQHSLEHQVHLNRIRFWVPHGAILTEFLLRFDHYHIVTDLEDLATGHINTL